MSRSRDLANLANNATGLETLTVSDITDLTATATELNYSNGVGSALQTQIDSKIGGSNPTITLGSNATFPAGHVIQTVQNTYNSSDSQGLAGTYTRFTIADASMPFTGQITNVKANSHVYIQMSYTTETVNTSHRVDVGTGVGIFREATSIFTPRNYQNYMYMSNSSGGISESKQFYHHMNLVFIDESPATGTNNYFAGGVAYLNSSVRIMASSPFYPFVCVLQEIAQ